MTSAVLYPFLVGSDIGCGIAVFPIRFRHAVPDRLAARFPDLDREPAPDDPAWAPAPADYLAARRGGALGAAQPSRTTWPPRS